MTEQLDIGAFFNEEEILDLCLEKLARQISSNKEITDNDPAIIFVNHYAYSKLYPSKYFIDQEDDEYDEPIQLSEAETAELDNYIDNLIKSKSIIILLNEGILEAKISENGDITYETTEYARKDLGAADTEFDINGVPIPKS